MRNAEYRANETIEQRESRLDAKRAQIRSYETLDQQAARQRQVRENYVRIQSRPPSNNELTLAAFNYDPGWKAAVGRGRDVAGARGLRRVGEWSVHRGRPGSFVYSQTSNKLDF